jgi:nicotinate dehydrogenase subunit A
MAINLKVNGRSHTLDLDPATPLLYALSDDLQLNGPKFGCGLGQCGACTVIVKGQAVRSCVTTLKSVEGSDVTTLEGIGTPEKPHPIQQAFIEEQAAQCGFCLNGVIMTAKAFLDKNLKTTGRDLRCLASLPVRTNAACCGAIEVHERGVDDSRAALRHLAPLNVGFQRLGEFVSGAGAAGKVAACESTDLDRHRRLIDHRLKVGRAGQESR